MIKKIHPIITLCLLLMMLVDGPASGAEGQPDRAVVASSADDALRAQALLDRAVKHYRANGEKALATFSLVGEFMDGDLYVYVVGEDGVLQASGGPSVTLVGRDVRNVKDAGGTLLFNEMLDGAMLRGEGSVAYRWLNREHGKVERKVAYYRKVGNVIVAVGYYIPRAAPQAAKALLARSNDAMANNAKEAIARFNDINGGFIEDDLYVFVVGMEDKIMYAHGAMPRLIGRKVDNMNDINGKPVIRQMIDIVKAKGSGELQYTWLNPVTLRQERKTTYMRRVDRYLVAVGHYMH
jgi:cytochrome c